MTNIDKYLNLKIWTSDFSSGPVNFSVTGPDGPVTTNSEQNDCGFTIVIFRQRDVCHDS